MERRAHAPDARETLEPMLDDLARGLGYDRALVLTPESDQQTLRGLFGLNIRDDIARGVIVPLTRPTDPLVAAHRSGIPQLVEDVATDDRLTDDERRSLLAMNVTRFVAASLPDSGERPSAVVVLARDREIGPSDLERLLPLARQAGAALTREHDVELLRRASESHAIEKEWLWWMLNAVDDPVLVSDANNDILHFNRRAELLFRASDEDSPGKRRAVWMNNFLFTASLSSWTLDRTMRPSTSREVTLVDPIDGSELIFEVITRPALNHRTGERGTVSVLKDVTDIRHMTVELTRSAQRIQTADEEIRAERDRLDLLLRSVPNPVIVVDVDNQIISLNAAAQRLFTPRPGRGGQHARANDAKFTSFLAQLRLEPKPQHRAELVLVDPLSEERLEMEVTASEVRDQHGAVVAIVSAMSEVGRLRELERRRLEQVLFETEKLAATGRLAASIAHEINNPLEAVQNALYLLGGVVTRDKRERRYLDIAQRETQRMSRILRQMLGFYRPTKVVTQVDVNALIDEAEGLVAKQLRTSKITISRELDPELPPIRGSSDQLKQVLLNLFLNAAEAMPEGGTLNVATRYGTAEGDLPYEAVRIEVRDTGVGMDEETQARIFEPFFSTKAQRGTGLGLWVSHGIVQGHGGTIKVRSRVGQGTTFTIALPVAGPPDATDG